MSESRQNAILGFTVLTCIGAWGAACIAAAIYHDQHTDNQVISTLHAQNAALQRDFTDTSVALDSIVLKNNALEEENSRLKAELEMAKDRGRL